MAIGRYFGDFEYQRSVTRLARYQALQNTTLVVVDYADVAVAIRCVRMRPVSEPICFRWRL